MKLVGILHAFAGFREAPEEYTPASVPHPHDVVNVVRAAYQFTGFPILTPGQTPPNTYQFTAGRFSDGERTFGITQLIMSTEGDAVLTLSTDDSDIVLENLVDLLDSNFGYRLRQSNLKKRYLSNLVVQFDEGLEVYMAKLGEMEREINKHDFLGRDKLRFKQIAFGDRIEAQRVHTDPILLMEAADFIIERRAGYKFDENRFYCSAPLPTLKHIETLERLEAIARGAV
jgi:hypothetical protein